MRIEKYPSPMHPEQKHVYAFDFTKALAAIGDGSDTIAAGPTVTVISPNPAPPGLTISGVAVQTNTKVIYTVDIDAGSHEDDAYVNPGTEICLQCNGVSSGGDDLVQQAILVVTDQC